MHKNYVYGSNSELHSVGQNLTIHIRNIKNMQSNSWIFKIYSHVNFFSGSCRHVTIGYNQVCS